MATFWNKYQSKETTAELKAREYASPIYIGSDLTQRYIALPAFIGDLKYTIDKDTTVIEERDKEGTDYIQRSSTLALQLTLDLPAYNYFEAKNNLIKIEEIMRMISPVQGANLPRVFILFSNLISRGTTAWCHTIDNFINLSDNGLPGYIKEFDYKPDIESGFFYDSEYRAPRNIKVQINFSIEALPAELLQILKNEKGETTLAGNLGYNNMRKGRWIIRGLCTSGEYTSGDTGMFPFGVSVGDSRKPYDFNFQSLNSGNKNPYAQNIGSYFTISNGYISPIGERKDFKNNDFQKLWGDQISAKYITPVWLSFKMFLEDYTFKKKTDLEPIQIKDSDAGVFYNNFSNSNSEISIKFSILADSLAEAKKNCGKIQVLFRLFLGENLFNQKSIDHDYQSNTKRKIYAPNLFENPKSTKSVPNGTNAASTIFDNGVDSVLTKLDVNIVNDLGYFIETTGSAGYVSKKYYPKGFTITLAWNGTGFSGDIGEHPGNYKTQGEERGTRLSDPKDNIQYPFKFK